MSGNATLPSPAADLPAVRSLLGAAGDGLVADLDAASVAVLGGPAIDGIAAQRSGIEVYAAVDQPADADHAAGLADRFLELLPGSFRVPVAEPYLRIHAAPATPADGEIDVTVFDVRAVLGQATMLRDQCLANSAGPLFGHPPAALLRVLHALHGGQALWGEARLEDLQTSIGSDFYPLLMLLFALNRALDACRDLRALAAADQVARADAAGRLAHAVADAVTAWSGKPVPDDRYRLASLRQLEAAQPGLLRWEPFYEALFPVRRDPALEPAIDVIRSMLHSPLVAVFPQAQLLRTELDIR